MNIFQRLFRRVWTSAETGGVYIEPRSGLVFPMELGGLHRRAMGRRYADGDRLGESISYGADDTEATVYVTSVGRAEFPDGGDSELARGELEGAMAAVREMEQLGHYQSVKFFAAGPECLGTAPGNLTWARGAFFTQCNGRPMMSFTYTTALSNNAIKLRISAPNPRSKTLTEFPHALGDLISGQRSQSERR